MVPLYRGNPGAGTTTVAFALVPNDPTAARPIAPGTPMPDVPVLVIAGDLDANTPSSAGRQVASRAASSRTHRPLSRGLPVSGPQ